MSRDQVCTSHHNLSDHSSDLKAGFEAYLSGNLQRKGLWDRRMWSAVTQWIQGFDNSSGIARIRHEETTGATSMLGLHPCDNLVSLALL